MDEKTEGQKKNKFSLFLKTIFDKIFRINDSPQRIALGLGTGVFLGVLPAAGPIASVTLATLLRFNKASALLGCLLVNTWINIVTFIFAVKIGARLTQTNWQELYNNSIALFKDFHFSSFFKLSIIKLLYPLLLGYCVIGLGLGICAYIATLLVLNVKQKKRKSPV